MSKSQLSTYYGIQYVDTFDNLDYQEFLVNEGRVDPGDNIKVKIEYESVLGIQADVTTPDGIIHPFRINLNPDNVYHVDIGKEATDITEEELHVYLKY